MKPLLIVPLTLEDKRIWAAIAARQPWLPVDEFWPDFQAAHRRDAALMLRVQTNRWAEIRDDSALFDVLPPWLLPMQFDCGPVGGDIERYITCCA